MNDDRHSFWSNFCFVCFWNVTRLELCTRSCKTTAVSLVGFYIKSVRNEFITFRESSEQIYLHDRASYFLFLSTPIVQTHNSLKYRIHVYGMPWFTWGLTISMIWSHIPCSLLVRWLPALQWEQCSGSSSSTLLLPCQTEGEDPGTCMFSSYRAHFLSN